MNKLLRTDVPNMAIDPATGAVLNTDTGGYAAIKAAREEKKRQYRLEDRITKLEAEVEGLKKTIQQLMTSMRLGVFP